MTAILGLLGLIGSTVFLISLFVPDWTWVAMRIYGVLQISAAILLAACIAVSPASFFRRARAQLLRFIFSRRVFLGSFFGRSATSSC